MSDEQKPFEQPGKHADEITIRFKDDTKLYVSKAFLGHVSPVFLTMFNGKFKEAQKSEVDIKDSSRASFLEFLLCLDPGTMKDVTSENVFRVVIIAHKYNARALVNRCKNFMDEVLKKPTKTVAHSACLLCYPYETTDLHVSLQILRMATFFYWSDTANKAIQFISRFPSYFYLNSTSPRRYKAPSPNIVDKIIQTLKGIPLEARYKVLHARLQKTESE